MVLLQNRCSVFSWAAKCPYPTCELKFSCFFLFWQLNVTLLNHYFNTFYPPYTLQTVLCRDKKWLLCFNLFGRETASYIWVKLQRMGFVWFFRILGMFLTLTSKTLKHLPNPSAVMFSQRAVWMDYCLPLHPPSWNGLAEHPREAMLINHRFQSCVYCYVPCFDVHSAPVCCKRGCVECRCFLI